MLQADQQHDGGCRTVDEIPVRISDTVTSGTVVPTYPVIQYPHTAAGGDAIAGGFVYRGKALPALQGKYVFGDISTGRIWYADYKEMLAADDSKSRDAGGAARCPSEWSAPGEARSPAAASIRRRSPSCWRRTRPAAAPTPICRDTSTVSGPGRADVRFAVDAAGELYLLSKVDGMIRAVVGAAKLAKAVAVRPVARQALAERADAVVACASP